MTSDNAPGLYRKGSVTRRAFNAAEAVQLQYDGFGPVTEVEAPTASYRELQKRASDLGIKANQSADELSVAIAEAEAGSAGQAPDTSNTSALDEVETTTDNS